MSDVERFWDAARKHWNSPAPSWHELPPDAQNQVLTGINFILGVLNADWRRYE